MRLFTPEFPSRSSVRELAMNVPLNDLDIRGRLFSCWISSSIAVSSCSCGCLLLVCNVIVCIIRTRCFVSISFVSAKHRQQSQWLIVSYQLQVFTSARLHIVPYCCCGWIIVNIGDVIVADVIVRRAGSEHLAVTSSSLTSSSGALAPRTLP